MGKFNWLKYLFLALGVGCLLISFVLWNRTRHFVATANHTTGSVIEMRESRDRDDNSSTYRPVVRFTTLSGDETVFVSNYGSNPPGYQVGDAVPVLYSPARPMEARIESFGSLWSGALILAGIGGVFTVVAASIIGSQRRKARRIAGLAAHGKRVQAEITGIEQDTTLRVRGRHPWKILAQWQDPRTSDIHLFESDNLWFDPTAHVKGTTIPVLLDEGDPANYHVDVSTLPKAR